MGNITRGLNHRSNDVQMKMKVYQFYNEVEPLVKTKLAKRR